MRPCFLPGTRAAREKRDLEVRLNKARDTIVPRAQALLEAHVRDNVQSAWHPSCTCKMGDPSDPMAVVDSRLRVRGIGGLRVADASVLPTTIAATNIPCMLVGEKCADMVLADAAV